MDYNPPFLDALKQGILLERKGKAFYLVAASQTESPAVKAFFNEMAAEEIIHDRYLSQIFANYQRSGEITNIDFSNSDIRKASRTVIDQSLITSISSAGYEAAAISAAIDMEKRSIDLYTSQAEKSTDRETRDMFLFLSNWEKEHLAVLMQIDAEFREKVWLDNNFWPF